MCTATVQSVYTVQSVGARAGAWERASCAWPGLGAWRCLARWRRPDSPGQSVSWPPHSTQGDRGVTLLSLVSLAPLSSRPTSGSTELDTSGTGPGHGTGVTRGAAASHQSGEHRCPVSAVDTVKVTQQYMSCCEVPGCCLKASYSQ